MQQHPNYVKEYMEYPRERKFLGVGEIWGCVLEGLNVKIWQNRMRGCDEQIQMTKPK